MRTSYSSIETYLQCPQKYKFQYIDKIKASKSRDAIFGTLIHDALKFMFSRNPLFPTLDEVVMHFQEHWPATEKFSPEEDEAYMSEGIKILKKFYERNAPWNFIIMDLESKFEVTLTDEKTGKIHILAGIIDRIDKLPHGGYEIIDYKTAKRMPPQSAVDKNLQLSLYALGIEKRWPHIKPEEITLSLYFLKHGEKLSTKASVEVANDAKGHALRSIAEIETRISENKPFEPMPGPLCDWCPFKPICPAWKHLYKKNDEVQMTNDEVNTAIKEYFEIKKSVQKDEARLDELQEKIEGYMAAEGLTRVFGDEGMISKKTIQRYQYDWEKIKSLLSPLGKWEEVLKTDETKLKKTLLQVPENIRDLITETKTVAKEYSVFSAVRKNIANPDKNNYK